MGFPLICEMRIYHNITICETSDIFKIYRWDVLRTQVQLLHRGDVLLDHTHSETMIVMILMMNDENKCHHVDFPGRV